MTMLYTVRKTEFNLNYIQVLNSDRVVNTIIGYLEVCHARYVVN